MLVVFLLLLAASAALYFLSKDLYCEFIAPVDEKRYSLKRFLPIGLYLLDKAGYKFNSRYDRGLITKIGELYGWKYAQYYLKIHWANKIAVFILTLDSLALIAVGAGADIGYGVFCLIVLGCIVYFTDNELNERIKKRRLLIQLDFPGFLNKLTLLINAGMTIPKAWEKIVLDNNQERPLYEELEATILDIRAGKSEINAYEEFAKRCRIQEVTKFVSVVIQNMKKGNSELVPILRLQASECWEMRKNAARRLGEEASTKMLLPMMIMFLAILIIVAMPAILALRGI